MNRRDPKLRASYVWCGEVMADAMFHEPAPVTIGPGPPVSKPSRWSALAHLTGVAFLISLVRAIRRMPERDPLPTFVTAPLELPESYPILRPGKTGYVLTVSNKMGGTLSLGGNKVDVSEFARAEGARGAFRATAVNPGDWGVIHLDNSGEHTIFFQFVDADPPIPTAGWRDSDELLLPAIAFSVFIHAAFLAYAFYYYTGTGSGFGFPGSRELVADYLVSRPAGEEPPTEQPKAGTTNGDEKAEPASTVGKEAKQGGEGEKPRKRAPNPDKGEPAEALPKSSMNVGLVNKRAREKFEKIAMRGGFDKRLGDATARLQGLANDGSAAGFGPGRGTGIGTGTGTGTTKTGSMAGVGGGGKAHQDVRTTGKLDTGGSRAARGLPDGKGVKEAKVSVKPGKAGGRLGGLTEAQIRKVVMARRNAIRTCYERQLQRQKGLSGKVVIRWKIASNGSVKGAKVSTSSLNSGAVEDCIVRQFARMKFPSPGSGEIPVVKFPFIFSAR